MKYAIHVRRTQAGEQVIDRTLTIEARSGAHAQGVVTQWLRQQDMDAMYRGRRALGDTHLQAMEAMLKAYRLAESELRAFLDRLPEIGDPEIQTPAVTTKSAPVEAAGTPDLIESDWLDANGRPPYRLKLKWGDE